MNTLINYMISDNPYLISKLINQDLIGFYKLSPENLLELLKNATQTI